MLRPSAILGALFTMAAFTLPAAASGDSPPDTANRYQPPQFVIRRILESEQADAAKLESLRRFAQVGDLECLLDRKLGKPRKVIVFTIPSGRRMLYCYESGLAVLCIGMKVSTIYRPSAIGYVSLSNLAEIAVSPK
jgi:hypothetical protein